MKLSKNTKTALYVGIALFILYHFNTGGTMAVYDSEDFPDDWSICAGEVWVCCEEDTYYFDEVAIRSALGGESGLNHPGVCCEGLTKTKVEILTGEPWFQTLGEVYKTIFHIVTFNYIPVYNDIKDLIEHNTNQVAYVCEDVPIDLPGSDIIQDEFNLTAKAAFWVIIGIAALALVFLMSAL